MGRISANIQYLHELEFAKFDIPFYQRPYRWQTSHVDTLLTSLKDNQNKTEYRIGSIIINPNDDKFEIVDGQQRLTTLSLLFMCLEGKDTIHKLSCEFDHSESQQNIYNNFRYIQQWLKTNNINRLSFLEFILNKCSIVVIEAQDLSDAFQMFDSQNGRGKELEAYNLLKAYHLRAIDNETTSIKITDEKKEIDRRWESSVVMKSVDSDESLLKNLINSLYRIRQWSNQRDAWTFGKTKVKEFKGIQFRDSRSELPLTNKSLLLYLYYNSIKGTAPRSSDGGQGQNPFVSITMDIINGKLFFEYIETYVKAYEYVIKEDKAPNHPLYEFQNDFKKYCLGYEGAFRKGDTYIREVYIALVIALYDRFGEEYVQQYYKTLYNLAYRERINLKRVFYERTAKFPKEYFECIATSIDDSGLNALREYANAQIDWRTNNVDIIANYILQSGGHIIREGNIVTGSETI